MADQNIDFRQGGDSGERDDPDAIERYNDGEPASETVFRRPPENLRSRTEILRTEGEDQKYLQDSDMRWMISAGSDVGVASGANMPSVSWDATTGKFTISDEIVVQPLSTPATDSKETKTYTWGVSPSDVDFNFIAQLFAYEGMNWREIHWEEKPPAEIPNNVCEAVVSGDPKNILTITIRDDGNTQAQDVDDALTLIVADLTTMGITYSMVGLNSVYITLPTSDAIYRFQKTWEREMHHITPTAFSDFFTSESLSDGDTLAIFYDMMYDPTPAVGGRKQSTIDTIDPVTTFPPNTHVRFGQLFITSDEQEKIPLCIPICKRIGDDLIFLDGTIVSDPQSGTVHFGENGYTLNALAAAASSVLVSVTKDWYGGLTPSFAPSSVIEDCINGMILDLAEADDTLNMSGARRVGVDAYDGTPPGDSLDLWAWIDGSVRSTFETAQTVLNRKASLAYDENVTGDWTFDGEETFNGVVNLNQRVNLNSYLYLPLSGVVWDLYLKNTAVGATTHTDFMWGTVSHYEYMGGAHMMLIGAKATSFAVQNAAPDDIGTGTVIRVVETAQGDWRFDIKSGLSAGDPIDWDTSDLTYWAHYDSGDSNWKHEFRGLVFWEDGGVSKRDVVLAYDSTGVGVNGRLLLRASDEHDKGVKSWLKTNSSGSQPRVSRYYMDEISKPGNAEGVIFIDAYNCTWSHTTFQWSRVQSGAAHIVVYTNYGIRVYLRDPASSSTWGTGADSQDYKTGWDDYYDVIPRYSDKNEVIPSPYIMGGTIIDTAGWVDINDDLDWRTRYVMFDVVLDANAGLLTNAGQNYQEDLFANSKIVYLDSAGAVLNFERTYKSAISGTDIIGRGNGSGSEVDLRANTSTGTLQISTVSTTNVYYLIIAAPTISRSAFA